ncbi:MAG: tRNA (adenosine(37)-N6)-dimethylallyltransferase MiaA [Pseudomonadota bacterium]
MGPTASGKTEVAVRLAEAGYGGIISVDSALVYRGMDIGTAKPDAATLARAPHRLIDLRDPAEPYSAAEFCTDARAAMGELAEAGQRSLLVGGTLLYFRALERGLSPLPGADPVVRERLMEEGERLGWPALHARLAARDPASGERIHPNDPQRIQRALEIIEVEGRTPSELYAENAVEGLQEVPVKVALVPGDREQMHRRIEARFHAMLEQGLVDEVAELHRRGDLEPDLPALRAVGYRQVWEYLEGHYDHAEMVRRGIVATRRFAKRQLTWLRGEKDVLWIDPEHGDPFPRIVERLMGE